VKTPPRATLASRIYEPESGAAAYRLSALVRALDDDGFATTVLTTRPVEPVPSTPSVRRWPVIRDSAGAVRGYVQFASFDIPLFFRLLFLARPDVVIAEPPPTTGVVCRVICGLRRIPYVYFAADVTSRAAAGAGVNPLIVAVLRRVEGWVLRGAAAVLAVSPGVRDEVREFGVDPERITVVGTGIDTRVFTSQGEAAVSADPYLVYAGTMSEVHGAAVFIEAFARIANEFPTARLRMFGAGVEVPMLRELAATLGADRVEFPGLVSGEETARWIRGAHAGLASVRPGRNYDFAFATKAFATVGCGTPVIYAGVGPARELVADNDLGWAVDWDAEVVAEAMRASLRTAPTTERRRALSEWVDEHHSLRGVGARAAQAVRGVLPTAGV